MGKNIFIFRAHFQRIHDMIEMSTSSRARHFVCALTLLQNNPLYQSIRSLYMESHHARKDSHQRSLVRHKMKHWFR